ncbi:MAG TPA: hypothetical protein VMR23_01890 [Candidatus Limnocylindria bacterium]|nr:hypothetical protein [Candidatus Limnocylindria bacterium]
MGDNPYVMESCVRIRIAELHAAAARERSIAALPARPTLARRALAAVAGLMRTAAPRSTAVPVGEHPR